MKFGSLKLKLLLLTIALSGSFSSAATTDTKPAGPGWGLTPATEWETLERTEADAVFRALFEALKAAQFRNCTKTLKHDESTYFVDRLVFENEKQHYHISNYLQNSEFTKPEIHRRNTPQPVLRVVVSRGFADLAVDDQVGQFIEIYTDRSEQRIVRFDGVSIKRHEQSGATVTNPSASTGALEKTIMISCAE